MENNQSNPRPERTICCPILIVMLVFFGYLLCFKYIPNEVSGFALFAQLAIFFLVMHGVVKGNYQTYKVGLVMSFSMCTVYALVFVLLFLTNTTYVGNTDYFLTTKIISSSILVQFLILLCYRKTVEEECNYKYYTNYNY